MRFNNIELTNYRCFDYAKLSFNEQDDKTINIIEGENGSGKTELLFAFQWALYGFDFSKLQGKYKNTFSLNSNLYYELSPNKTVTKPKAIVIIELEADNIIYTINCTETFMFNKSKNRITSQTYRKISYKNNKNEFIEIHKIDEQVSDYDKIITKLIPQKILNGLLFDGEKMMELTSFSTTNKAIEGIIEEITSSSNIDSMSYVYKTIRRKTASALSKLTKNTGNIDIAKKIAEQSKLSDEIDELENILEADKSELHKTLESLELIEKKLDEYKDNKNYIIDRKHKEELIKTENIQLKKYQKSLISTISLSGYLLLSQPLFDSVSDLLESSDIPKGLNSEAVQSIIDSKVCLCGEPLDEAKIEKLKSLKAQLPPININSTIKESLSSLQTEKNKVFDKIRQSRNDLKEIQENLNKLEAEKQTLSKKIIINSNDHKLAENEEKKQILDRHIGKLQANINITERNLKEKKKENQSLIKTINEFNTNDFYIQKLNKKHAFCENAILLIKRWKENNKKNALKIINKNLFEAYKILSEDYSKGKRIIICQHDAHNQYQIFVYFEEQLENKLNDFKNSGEYEKFIEKGLDIEEIKEKAILLIADANSQGQSEVNTLSFVKAIMDYASAIKHEGLEIKRDYPLIIDSPFGQLSGTNLNNVALNLSSFSNQIILMVSSSRLKEVENDITSKSLVHYKLIKSDKTNATTAKGE